MKVLFVHFGDDWVAGSEVALLELLRAMVGMNIEPHLWCNAPAMQQAAQKIGIPVDRDVFAHAFDYSSPRFSPSAYLKLVGRGKQLIAQSGAQIVHCNSAAPAQWMLPACRSRQTPLLINLHSRYHRRSRYVLGVHLADRVVAVSSSIAAPLLTDGMEADRIGIVYNGFDEVTLLQGSAAGLRESLSIPADALVGVIAGSLIRRKGHDILFQAMRSGAAGPFHLLVVGDGPERESYQKQTSGLPVHFLGHRDDVGPIMRDAADFLVAPSRQEAFGRVIVEAALAGIPAIGARVDGIPEAIQEDQTGLLVAPESPEAVAAAIARLSADVQLRHRLGAAAAKRAHELFTIERSARMMVEEYRRTIDRYRSPAGSGLRRLKPYLSLVGASAAPRESAA